MAIWKPTKAAHFIFRLLAQALKPYKMGAEVMPLSEPNPPRFDCSELVQWGLAQAGITEIANDAGTKTPINLFDGAGNQYQACAHIPLDDVAKTVGALLFIRSHTNYPTKPDGIGHVAVSLGNGYLIEARGKDYGVVIGLVRSTFNLGGKVRELYVPLEEIP